MKQRIITGAIGAVFVVVWLAFRNTVAFNIIIALAILMAMFEALIATKYVNNFPLLIVSLLYSAAVPFFQLINFFPVGLSISALFIFAVLIITLCQHNKIKLNEIAYTFMMSVIIPYSLSSILYLNAMPNVHPEKYSPTDGLFFVLISLCAAWVCDTGAYFVGNKFGRNKLAPEISPKKTVEGSIGGMLSVVVVYMIIGLVWRFAFIGENGSLHFGYLLLLAVLASVVGMIGDLSFSYIKRSCHIKDFGNIMPGHGGILDRIDSLLLTAPLVFIYLQYVPLVVRV